MKRPFFVIALCISCGIAIAAYIAIPFFYVFVAALVSAAFSLVAPRRGAPGVFLPLTMVFAGMLLFQNSTILPGDHVSRMVKGDPVTVVLEGSVADDPLVRPVVFGQKKSVFPLGTSSLLERGVRKSSSGAVLVEAYGDRDELNVGDEVVVEGELSDIPSLCNPGAFDYAAYMRMKNIYGLVRVKEDRLITRVREGRGIFRRTAYGLRHAIRKYIERYFASREAGFLESMIIGDRTNLPATTREEFVKTGTIHILAISGLNVMLIASIFLAAFKTVRIPKKVRYVLVTGILGVYTLVSGSNPPVLRASIAFAIYALGHLFEREPDALNSLGIAAFLLLVWNPKVLFDPSFQLSFTAILSLIVCTPKLMGLVAAREGTLPHPSRSVRARAGRYLIGIAAASVAAWLGTAPFIAHYFNIVSPVALLANIVIVPLSFLLFSALILFIIASAIAAPLAAYGAHIILWLEKVMFASNSFFARLPCSHVRVAAPSIAIAVFYYLVLFFLFSPLAYRVGRRRISKVFAGILILAVSNVIVWRQVCAVPDTVLRMTFLDVGYGDALYIEFPGGGTMLVDGGSGGREEDAFDMGRMVLAPFLWNRGPNRIDAIVLTHPHEDHMGGLLYIMDNFKIGCVIDNGYTNYDSDICRNYINTIRRRGLRHIVVREGDQIVGFDGITFDVISPREDCAELNSNDGSLVSRIVYKDMSVLLPGDIGEKVMSRLASQQGSLRSDVIKVPHHGGTMGGEDSVKSFFTSVRPKDAIISVSRRNRFNAPSKKTLGILAYFNSNIYETKEYGAITVVSDGKGYKINGCRTPAVR